MSLRFGWCDYFWLYFAYQNKKAISTTLLLACLIHSSKSLSASSPTANHRLSFMLSLMIACYMPSPFDPIFLIHCDIAFNTLVTCESNAFTSLLYKRLELVSRSSQTDLSLKLRCITLLSIKWACRSVGSFPIFDSFIAHVSIFFCETSFRCACYGINGTSQNLSAGFEEQSYREYWGLTIIILTRRNYSISQLPLLSSWVAWILNAW